MSTPHVLIVDDQSQVRAEVKERIESLGYVADEATCQEEALVKVHSIQYDCVLLDLNIPVKIEGVSMIEHGRNALERIVSMAGAPPVIVITSYGLDGHKLAVEMMEIGAKSFVAKPFDGGHLEKKIKLILGANRNTSFTQPDLLRPFEGGVLLLDDVGIMLSGTLVGGVRAGSMIRSVVGILSVKKSDKYRKHSAQSLASAISNSTNPQSITAAIKEFRDLCAEKLRQAGINCPKDAVIGTMRGGGYQLRDWIEVRSGSGRNLSEDVDQDCDHVARAFGREKRLTLKQIIATVQLPAVQVRTAVQILEKRGRIKNAGGGGVTTTYELIIGP